MTSLYFFSLEKQMTSLQNIIRDELSKHVEYKLIFLTFLLYKMFATILYAMKRIKYKIRHFSKITFFLKDRILHNYYKFFSN